MVKIIISQLKKDYPIHGKVEGWYFKAALERNSGPAEYYVCSGADEFGRTVSFQTQDVDNGLNECYEYAKSMPKLNHKNSDKIRDYDGNYS